MIRRSWTSLRAEPEAVTERFYARLFAIKPSSRRLFRNRDMRLQVTAFTQMLSLFVRSLDEDAPGVMEAIEASGRRHVEYGVAYSDYESAGRALLWALEESLGPAFTPELRGAWDDAYRLIAAKMRGVSSGTL